MPIINFLGKPTVDSYHYLVPPCRIDFDPKLSELPKSSRPTLDGNVIIEGDNLLALKALIPTHAGKIKCIYIDPPYNTGNEGWVYNDNLSHPRFKAWIGQVVGKEGEDDVRHDKWCCMMWPRLNLLKELLRDDGAIFISIDDNEVHHLRQMMDEIFGEENFLATVCWQKVFAPKPAAKTFSTSVEYIVAYARKTELWDRHLLPRTKEQNDRYTNPDHDPRGDWSSDNLLRNEHRDNSVYEIVSPSGKSWVPQPGTSWRHPESEMLDLIASNQIWFGENGDNMPRRKKFLTDVIQGRVPETLWPYDEVGHTQDATRALRGILGQKEKDFPFPKPIALVQRVVQICTGPNDIILDSFAGSGTTAHAVLKLNAEDGGKRTFILVQQPHDNKDNEKDKFNICEKVTAERVRRVIKGYKDLSKNGKGKKVDGLGGHFTYARVGAPIFGEYKDIVQNPPTWNTMAAYVYRTETFGSPDPKLMDEKTGFVGKTDHHGGTSYYLLYDPSTQEGREVSIRTLEALLKNDKSKKWVIYADRLWMHDEDRLLFAREHGRSIRFMSIPWDLRSGHAI